MKNGNVCENEPHPPPPPPSPLRCWTTQHPGLFFEIPTPPQLQSISLLSDSPETRFSSSDRHLIPPLASGLYLNAPSRGRDPTPHGGHQRHPSLPLVLLSLSLLFLASLTASRDGAVGEGRCGERVGCYLLSTGFAGEEAVFLQRQGMNINCR